MNHYNKYIIIFLVFIYHCQPSAQLIDKIPEDSSLKQKAEIADKIKYDKYLGLYFKVGLAIAAQKGISPNYRTGMMLSVNYDIHNINKLSFASEVSYKQKGMIEKIIVTDPLGQETGIITMNNRLDYLSFGINAKYYLFGKYLNSFVGMGPKLDILINKNVTYNEVYDKFCKVIFGGCMVIGTELHKIIYPYKIIAEVQYEPDYLETYSYKTEYHIIRNNFISFNLGIGI